MLEPRETKRQKAGRARLVLWLGAFALLVQALLPAAALAAQARTRGEQLVICTSMGVRTISVTADGAGQDDDSSKGFAGLPCQDCLAAAGAVIPAPHSAAQPVAYAYAAVEHSPERSWAPQMARAPPRPPGQGPPQT